MTDNRRRRTGLVVLWVVFAALMAGGFGVGAVFLTQRASADRLRADQVAELEATNAELASQRKELVYATTNRDLAESRLKVAVAQVEQDRTCVEYIRAILREMRTKTSMDVSYADCRQ